MPSKIFWLDDRSDQIEYWMEVLVQDPEVTVSEARNLVEAATVLSKDHFDLYIVDIMMPAGPIPSEFHSHLAACGLSERNERGGLLVAYHILSAHKDANLLILTSLPNAAKEIPFQNTRARVFWKEDERVTVEAIKAWCGGF